VGWAWLLLLLLVHSAGRWGMLPRIPSGAHANEASCGVCRYHIRMTWLNTQHCERLCVILEEDACRMS
jgi:hypothetical protein